MSNQWHYSQEGAQYGPVDEAEIIQLIQDGELPPSTPVLKVGSMEWQPARNHACFQVEIYPKKKVSKQVATSTTSKPAAGGTSQSPRRTTTQPAATSSPAVTTVVVKEKSVLPWMVAGGAVVVALYLYFNPAQRDEDIADAPQTLLTPLKVSLNSRWTFSLSGTDNLIHDKILLPNGKVKHFHPNTDHTPNNDFWEQRGEIVIIRLNNDYATYEGRMINVNTMRGTAKNIKGKTWQWSATRK